MSSENKYLALRLQGPLQSWGFDSQYNRRNTGLMPTKSGPGRNVLRRALVSDAAAMKNERFLRISRGCG